LLYAGARVVLFGSRARGDYDSLSDYDLLVITPLTLNADEKIMWSSKIDKVEKYMGIYQQPSDIYQGKKGQIL